MPNWFAIENNHDVINELEGSQDIVENQNIWVNGNDVEIVEADPNKDFIKNMGQEFKNKYWENFDIDKFNDIANNIIAELIKEFWADKSFEIFQQYWKESISNIIDNYYDIFSESRHIIICKDIIERHLKMKIKNKEEEWKNKEEEWKNKEENKIKEQEEERKTQEEEWKNKETIELQKEKLDGLYEKNISDKFKWSDEELITFQQKTIEDQSTKWVDIIGKLKEKAFDVETYFRYLFTAQKLIADNEAPIENKYKFVKTFNELNKSLDIDIQLEMEAYSVNEKRKLDINTFSTKRSISLVDVAEGERILDNKDFQKFKDSPNYNIENLNLGKNKKSILKLYSKDKKNLNQIMDYINDDWSINEQKIDEIIKNPNKKAETVENLNNQIKKSLEIYQQDLQEKTEQKIKERIVSNCVKSVASIFNQTTENMENFAKDFKIDSKNWINFDAENQEIYIKWDINWKHVGIYYNIQTWVVEMDDFMWYDTDENGWTYMIWKENGKREKLKFNLPKYSELLAQAKKIDLWEIIKKSDDITDYEKNLWSRLDNKISSEFKNQAILKYYVEKFNEKNIAEQSILEDVFSSRGNYDNSIINFDQKTIISKDLNTNWHDLMEVVFNTLEWNVNTNENKMDADNLRRFRDCISKFNMIINTNQVKNWLSWEPLLWLFDDNTMKDSATNFKNWWELNYLTFFNLISKWNWTDKTIDLDLFENVLNIIDKWDEIKWNTELSKYYDFNQKYEIFASNSIDTKYLKKIKDL